MLRANLIFPWLVWIERVLFRSYGRAPRRERPWKAQFGKQNQVELDGASPLVQKQPKSRFDKSTPAKTRQ